MATTEYLAFLPLLFYGIALSDLLNQWKRFFDLKKLYYPYLLYTFVLSELGVYNVYVYIKIVKRLESFDYFSYLTSLITPMLFLLSVSLFTPDKDLDTRVYFNKNKPLFFSILALFIVSHYIFNLDEHMITILSRIGIAILLVVTGFMKNEWTAYLPILAWIIFFWFRTMMKV